MQPENELKHVLSLEHLSEKKRNPHCAQNAEIVACNKQELPQILRQTEILRYDSRNR